MVVVIYYFHNRNLVSFLSTFLLLLLINFNPFLREIPGVSLWLGRHQQWQHFHLVDCFLYYSSVIKMRVFSYSVLLILAFIEAVFLMCVLILGTAMPLISVVFLEQETNAQNKKNFSCMNTLERLTAGNRNMDLQLYLWSCYLPLGVFTCAETALPQWQLCADTQQHHRCGWIANGEFFSQGKKRAVVLFMLH